MPKLPRKGHKNKPKGKRPPQKRRFDPTDDRNDIVISNPNAVLEPKRKLDNGDSGRLLRDPKRLAEDLKLVEESTSKGWNVQRKNMIRRRLESILEKTTGDMNTKDGIVSSETVADNLAIRAATVLAGMDAADVVRLKSSKPETPTSVVNVTNNVINNNGFDERTIELARLASNIGARTLTISGRPVPISEILGTVSELPTQERSESDKG